MQGSLTLGDYVYWVKAELKLQQAEPKVIVLPRTAKILYEGTITADLALENFKYHTSQ